MLNLKELFNKVRPKQKPILKTEEEIKIGREKWLEEALVKSAKLNKLINADSGWKEFVEIIEEYISRAYIQKMEISIKDIMCSTIERDKRLMELALMDEDIYILTKMIQAPKNFINNIEKKVKDNREDV
jgi:hypothetical protein